MFFLPISHYCRVIYFLVSKSPCKRKLCLENNLYPVVNLRSFCASSHDNLPDAKGIRFTMKAERQTFRKVPIIIKAAQFIRAAFSSDRHHERFHAVKPETPPNKTRTSVSPKIKQYDAILYIIWMLSVFIIAIPLAFVKSAVRDRTKSDLNNLLNR